MIRRIILLGILFIIGLAVPTFADETGNGIIKGQTVNGTAGGSSAAGVEVNLNIYQNGVMQTPSITRTDTEGMFVFTGLATEPAYSYEVAATFQGVKYRREPVTFAEGNTTISIGIPIYDTTDNDEAISVAMSHTILYAEEHSVLVKEYYLFTNGADRAYVGPAAGSDNGTLLFHLPQGATELQATIGLADGYTIIGENNFVDTMPVLPGMYEVAYTYRINQSPANFTFTQGIIYPTRKFDFLVQGDDIKIKSDQLTPDEPLNISGSIFTHLSGGELVPGTNLAIHFSGLPSTGNPGAIWLVLLGAIIVIGAGIMTIRLVKKKKPEAVNVRSSLNQRQAQLINELAELDDRFEYGSIKEAYYRKLRGEKKAELIKLMQKLKEE